MDNGYTAELKTQTFYWTPDYNFDCDLFNDSSGKLFLKADQNTDSDSFCGTFTQTVNGNLTYIEGRQNYGFYFDGATEIISDYTITGNAFSVSFYSKISQDSNNMKILGVSSQNNLDMCIIIENSKVLAYFKSSAIDLTNSIDNFWEFDDKWHHYSFSFHTSGCDCYKDGIKQGTIVNPIGSCDTGFVIGNVNDGNDNFFKGGIDHIRTFDRILTEEEHYQLFDECKGKLRRLRVIKQYEDVLFDYGNYLRDVRTKINQMPGAHLIESTGDLKRIQ